MAYQGTTPDYWIRYIDDDEFIATAIDLITPTEE